MVEIKILRRDCWASNGCDCCEPERWDIYQAYVDGQKVEHNFTPYDEDEAIKDALLFCKDIKLVVEDGEW